MVILKLLILHGSLRQELKIVAKFFSNFFGFLPTTAMEGEDFMNKTVYKVGGHLGADPKICVKDDRVKKEEVSRSVSNSSDSTSTYTLTATPLVIYPSKLNYVGNPKK